MYRSICGCLFLANDELIFIIMQQVSVQKALAFHSVEVVTVIIFSPDSVIF